MSNAHRQDRDCSAPCGEIQEALRLAAAGRIAVARDLAHLYDELLEPPLPEELSAHVSAWRRRNGSSVDAGVRGRTPARPRRRYVCLKRDRDTAMFASQ